MGRLGAGSCDWRSRRRATSGGSNSTITCHDIVITFGAVLTSPAVVMPLCTPEATGRRWLPVLAAGRAGDFSCKHLEPTKQVNRTIMLGDTLRHFALGGLLRWEEREAVENAAWSVGSVQSVDDR